MYRSKELKQRLWTTLCMLFFFRLGAHIVLPGIDPSRLTGQAKGVFGLLDTLLGGSFSNVSVFGLGVMPYISASIIIQLLTIALPSFQRLQREGHAGRKKLSQWTKMLAVFVSIMQAVAYLTSAVPSDTIAINKRVFIPMATLTLTAGTMFCVWLGDQITDKGVGNGVSMLITTGIVSNLPRALAIEAVSKGMQKGMLFVFELVTIFFITMALVAFTKATRRIPLQYAKQMTGGYVASRQRQYIPLKLNTSGVMPIIFSQAIMFVPTLVANALAHKNNYAAALGRVLSDFTTWQYNVTFATLIVTFTFFYNAVTIHPTQMADDMKRNGGFVPGIKPGAPTAAFIDTVLSRITLPGSLFLAAVAILPALAHKMGVSTEFSRFYGGTSLLIMVGVVLETLQQVESILLMRRYEGLMQGEPYKKESAYGNAADTDI